jgi:hypothetical protein
MARQAADFGAHPATLFADVAIGTTPETLFAFIRVHSRFVFVLLAIFCGYSQAFLALYETIFD